MDPLIPYVKGFSIDIESIPVEKIKDAMLFYNHVIQGDFVYGIKWVSEDYKHMFASHDDEPYEKGKTYKFVDACRDMSKFNIYLSMTGCGVHGAGLWSEIADLSQLDKKLVNYKNVTLCRPILVKYPIQTTIPIGNTLKGKIMEVVSIDVCEFGTFLTPN